MISISTLFSKTFSRLFVSGNQHTSFVNSINTNNVNNAISNPSSNDNDEFITSQKSIASRRRTQTITNRDIPPSVLLIQQSSSKPALERVPYNNPLAWIINPIEKLTRLRSDAFTHSGQLYNVILVELLMEDKKLPPSDSADFKRLINALGNTMSKVLNDPINKIENAKSAVTSHYGNLRDLKILLTQHAELQKALHDGNAAALADHLHSLNSNPYIPPQVMSGLLRGEIKLNKIPKLGNPELLALLERQAEPSLLVKVKQEIAKKYPESSLLSQS